MENIRELLKQYKAGQIGEDEMLLALKKEPFVELDFAKIDTHRGLRQGAQEIIYGAGKTAEQIASIIRVMLDAGQKNILVTRLDEEKSGEVTKKLAESDIINVISVDNGNVLNDVFTGSVSRQDRDMVFDEGIPDNGCVSDPGIMTRENAGYQYYADAHLAVIGGNLRVDTDGYIAVITAGTSDIPVAEEAARTAEFLGNRVKRIYDAGVAGIHRLMAHIDDIMGARVIIAIAGMEGALASVVGGLASCPVIAVPTSVGYGASFEGITALLAMINSCASGVSVVNIDNGFGAAYQASMINHI